MEQRTDDQKDFFSDSANLLKGYVEDRLALARLELVEKLASFGGMGIFALLLGGVTFLFFLFFSVLTASALNTFFGNEWAGYAILSGFFLVLLCLLIVRRRQIITGFMNVVIKNLMAEDDE